MGRASHPPARPTYEELEAIIKRKDKAVSNCYWNAHAVWSIAWLAHQAHESGNVDYTEQLYAEATAYTLRHIAGRVKALHEELEEEHRLAGVAISPEAGDAR